jgi:hypothetical protein
VATGRPTPPPPELPPLALHPLEPVVTLSSDAPTTDAPAADVPTTDAPAADAPTTDAPAADAPAADAPAVDAPADAPVEFGPCCDAAMRPGGPHSDLAVRHVLDSMMSLAGRETVRSLAAVEAATDKDAVAGHSSDELLACMRMMDLGWPESEMRWCVSGCL